MYRILVLSIFQLSSIGAMASTSTSTNSSSSQPVPNAMSASMNMAITIFGFVLSALFIIVICCRLLCSRFRQSQLDPFQTDNRRNIGRFSIEGSLGGLDQSVLTCFPTIKFNQHIFTSSEDNLCTICLSDYIEKEVLRILPRCGHAFHVSCIDVWLRQHYTCPVCRISLRIFAEWGQISGPLISISAKPRFVQGALPDSLFEQPKDFHTVVPVILPKEGIEWSTFVRNELDPEMAEPSSSSNHQLLEPRERHQLRLDVSSDSSSNHITDASPMNSSV